MKILVYILGLYSISTLAQPTKSFTTKEGTEEISFNQLFTRIGLKPSDTDTVYRLWTERKILEIETHNGTPTQGQLITFAFRISRKDEQTIRRVFYNSILVPSDRLIDISKRLRAVSKIQSSDSIPDWKPVLDADYYAVEIQTSGTTKINHYYSLFEQEMVEIKPVQDIFKLIDKSIFEKSISNLSLPPGQYRFISGNIIMGVK
jgi:hypothetical protein